MSGTRGAQLSIHCSLLIVSIFRCLRVRFPSARTPEPTPQATRSQPPLPRRLRHHRAR